MLDTINLSPSAQKATSKDRKLIGELEDSLAKILGSPPVRNEIYEPINQARTDISRLSTEQLLRKDCKVLKTPEITIAVPAVPLPSQVRISITFLFCIQICIDSANLLIGHLDLENRNSWSYPELWTH